MDYNVENYASIREALDECVKNGGGRVVVPKGEWHTGALHLGSNTELHIESGARVVFSDKPEDYLPVVFTRWEGVECYNYSPLIYAANCENVSVTGEGELYGSGSAWWSWKQLQGAAAKELYHAQVNGIAPEKRVYGTREAALRPSFIQVINCKNVLLEGFTIKEGPQWTIHPVYCENVTVRNVTVSTHGHNTDGLNPDSCKNVLIEGCTFETGDDCIAINAGMNEDGQRVNIPCENVEIRNCTMTEGHGAVVIGSAVSGGVKNIYAHDCRISGTMQGIRIKSMRGRGGYVENARFENMTIDNVSDQAIEINMYYAFSTAMPAGNESTRLENVHIDNVSGSGADTAVLIRGLPELKARDIILTNVKLSADKDFLCENVDGLVMRNVKIKAKERIENEPTVRAALYKAGTRP